MERSTNTLDELALVVVEAKKEGTKTGADSANEGTNPGADERKEGTNSAAGLNENSGASALRDKKGLHAREGLTTAGEAASRAAGKEEQGVGGG
jgi:hypothetical protein